MAYGSSVLDLNPSKWPCRFRLSLGAVRPTDCMSSMPSGIANPSTGSDVLVWARFNLESMECLQSQHSNGDFICKHARTCSSCQPLQNGSLKAKTTRKVGFAAQSHHQLFQWVHNLQRPPWLSLKNDCTTKAEALTKLCRKDKPCDPLLDGKTLKRSPSQQTQI